MKWLTQSQKLYVLIFKISLFFVMPLLLLTVLPMINIAWLCEIALAALVAGMILTITKLRERIFL
ncbi:MAG TPA: hypothetical protein PKA72_14630 [bacterium]|nr:hypothetical protein [bacterium]